MGHREAVEIGGATIVLAEDSGFAAATVRDTLDADGHEVLVARDGVEALALLRGERPIDLLITDGEMPRLGGLDLCRQVRADPHLALLPVIFLTASARSLADALDAGADDHLRKPFDPVELRARVRAALRAGRTASALRAERDVSLALIDSVRDGVLVLAADGRILRVNDALAGITGHPAERLVGLRPPYPFWPGELATDYERRLELALRTGVAGEADREYLSPAGVRRPVIVSLAAVAGRHAGGPAFVSTVKDVGDRRRAEERLRRSEEEARELARTQAALRRVAAAVAEGRPTDRVLDLVAREIAGLFRVEAGGVTRFSEDDSAVLVGSWASVDAIRLPAGTVLTTSDDSMTGRVRRTGEPTRARPTAYRGEGHVGRQSGVAAPVWVDGGMWGVVGALSTRADAFPDDAQARLGEFAELLGLAIASADARSALARLAATDALTGLDNRRTFEARMEEEIGRSRRSGLPLSLCVIDLDHFKAVNDRHGHGVGDATLRDLAVRMKSASRDGDVIARIGGEEFAWLLPATPRDGAVVVAERLRALVAADPFAVAGAQTLSIGIAELGLGDDAASLLRAADVQLYEAKRTGRDRVMA